MPRSRNPVDEASIHVAVLKAIISAEAQRALDRPLDTRNIDLGILPSDRRWSHDEAKDEIVRLFAVLELLLDHFNIAHMAASFENAARSRIDNAVGKARKTVEKGCGPGDRWPARLVREARHYQSLDSIGELIGLSGDDRRSFDAIKRVRNELDHGVPIKDVPSITGEDTRVALVEALERLRS